MISTAAWLQYNFSHSNRFAEVYPRFGYSGNILCVRQNDGDEDDNEFLCAFLNVEFILQ